MDLASFTQLLHTAAGQAALHAAEALQPRETDYLQHFQNLSRSFPPELARAALETAILRQEAAGKFTLASQLYFTRTALEQASNEPVAHWRTQRYQGFARLLDLGCSLGTDTLTLAEAAPVLGIDRDPLRLALAQANLQAAAPPFPAQFILADLRADLPLTGSLHGWGAFFDPGRRMAGRRLRSVAEYQPPLATIERWLPKLPALGVKLSPAVSLAELRDYPGEIEFISLYGDLKEAVLWLGPLRTAERRATVLPAGVSRTGSGLAAGPTGPPHRYIYEPDPAILRAGLVADLAAELGAHQLDADIAYLSMDERIDTPFARSWEVEAWFPFQLKRLRAYLREHRVGRAVIKKRGSPLEPEQLARQLKLQGDQSRVIFLTHLDGRPIVIVAYSGT